MGRLDWRGATFWLPSQADDLASMLPLDNADLEEAAWALTPDGRLLRGPVAILASVDALCPGGVPLASMWLSLPGVPRTADAVYDWVARNRARLPGTPACGVGRGPFRPGPGTLQEVARRLDEGGFGRQRWGAEASESGDQGT